MVQADLTRLFTERAQAVSAVVKPVPDLQAAFTYAVEVTKAGSGETLAAPGWDEATLSGLAPLCDAAGIALQTHGLRSRGADIYTGLTRAEFGSAETGTLIVDSRSEDLRLATMLSEIHVAVLNPQHIKPDIFALEKDLATDFARPPGYTAFITGASRTADIERVLTIGVHGPAQLHILLLEEGAA